MWRAARSALALDNLTSSGPFIPCQSEYSPRVVQSSSQGNETAPLKTSFSGKCSSSLAREFCRFTLIFLWFQGSWEIALNKPKLWKFKCNIFLFWIRQHFWNGFPTLKFYILKWSSDKKTLIQSAGHLRWHYLWLLLHRVRASCGNCVLPDVQVWECTASQTVFAYI